MYLFFFLLPDEPRFYPPRSVTPFLVPEFLQLFTSQAGSGVPIPVPSSAVNFVARMESGDSWFTNRELKHKRNSDFSTPRGEPEAQLKALTLVDWTQRAQE